MLDNSGLPPPLQTCTHIVHDNLVPLDCQLPLPVSGEVGGEGEEPRRLTCFPSLSRFTAKPPCPHPLPPSSSHVRSWCALNDDIKILTKTNTQTFFRYQILRNRDFFSRPNFLKPNSPKPKPRLFFRDQIFRDQILQNLNSLEKMAKVSKLRSVETKMSISEGVLLFGYDMVAEYILQF